MRLPVTWSLRSLQTFVKAREKALDMRLGLLLNSKKVLGRGWEVPNQNFSKNELPDMQEWAGML